MLGIIYGFGNAETCVAVSVANQSPNRGNRNEQGQVETQPGPRNILFHQPCQSHRVPWGNIPVISERMGKNQSRRQENRTAPKLKLDYSPAGRVIPAIYDNVLPPSREGQMPLKAIIGQVDFPVAVQGVG